MEIIQATLDDLTTLVEMGRSFFHEAGWESLLGWEDAAAKEALTDLIFNPDSIILVAKKDNISVGMIGALLYPLWYNPKIKIGQEFFWYIRPADRGGVGIPLLNKLEEIAREKGAYAFTMLSLEKMPSLDNLYSRLGYAPSEKTFIKRLA